jgi:hypothetical protein
LTVEIVRTGTRGMIWLEPLVEVERDGVRHGYGPFAPSDAAALFDGTLEGLGPVEEIPFFARQDRLTFARVGRIDPLDLADYEAHGGLAGLRRALDMDARRHRGGGQGERPARSRRRGLPDRDQVGDGAHRAGVPGNTSSATPMRAIQAPSPTGC